MTASAPAERRRPRLRVAALAEDVHAMLAARSRGRGFSPADLDVAADIALEYLDQRGLLRTDVAPPTLLLLHRAWPGRHAHTSVHGTLTAAQMAARQDVVTRRRVALEPDQAWVSGADPETRYPTWSWHPTLHGRPLADFVIVQTPVDLTSC